MRFRLKKTIIFHFSALLCTILAIYLCNFCATIALEVRKTYFGPKCVQIACKYFQSREEPRDFSLNVLHFLCAFSTILHRSPWIFLPTKSVKFVGK